VDEHEVEVETPFGPARAHVRTPADPRGALVLAHGAGGGVGAADLQIAAEVALARGWIAALVEHPYRVAGRKAPAPAKRLDEGWLAVIRHLREHRLAEMPLITGGRSLSARVACRTAAATGSVAVLCLAFPLHPPGKADDPTKSRLPELDAVEVPVLIVQGRSDPFGMPPAGVNREIVQVDGDHGLKADLDAVRAALEGWPVWAGEG
jgi:predicted alpha/beta-hydrolase family hydrolase